MRFICKVNVTLLIARRYLFAKKSHNIINIVSGISVFTVATIMAAMVIVVSAFNGLEKAITDIYNSFDPDIIITPAKGKILTNHENLIKTLDASGLIAQRTNVLEDNVLLRFDENQTIAVIKGVDSNYNAVTGIDTMLVEGSEYYLGNDTNAYSVLGYLLGQKLAVGNSGFTFLSVYSPKRESKNYSGIDPSAGFNTRSLKVAGLFSVKQQPEYDDKYAIVSLGFAQDLLDRQGQISGIELKLKDNSNVEKTRKDIATMVGDSYTVKNRYQLHEVLYKVINSEKWGVFLILSLIMVIAVFNIVGSLTMLIVEKRDDTKTLSALGFNLGMLRKIFVTEGLLITLLGAAIGLTIGLALCYAQLLFEFILMAGPGSLPYPIAIKPFDIGITFIIIVATGYLASLLTARRSISV